MFWLSLSCNSLRRRFAPVCLSVCVSKVEKLYFSSFYCLPGRATERRSVHNLKLLTVGCLLFPGDLDSCSPQPFASPWVQLVERVVALISAGVTVSSGYLLMPAGFDTMENNSGEYSGWTFLQFLPLHKTMKMFGDVVGREWRPRAALIG